ncbi:hypothetical protein MD484_g1577, partial [Candolleomyces efflorescens]
MRVSFVTLLPLVVSLSAWAASAHRYDGGAPLEARDWMDGLSTRDLEILERREVLADFTSRDLIEELSDRLERRGNSNSSSKKKKTFGCPYCGKQYDTFDKAKACATLPAILGGCKVAGAVKQTQ